MSVAWGPLATFFKRTYRCCDRIRGWALKGILDFYRVLNVKLCREKLLHTIIEKFPCHTIVITAMPNLNIDPGRLPTWMTPAIGNATNVRNYLIANIN